MDDPSECGAADDGGDGGDDGDDGGDTNEDACAGQPAWVGDGFCDSENNNAACDYDGGDCCFDTCTSGEYVCGDNGYDCIDPDAQGDGDSGGVGDSETGGDTGGGFDNGITRAGSFPVAHQGFWPQKPAVSGDGSCVVFEGSSDPIGDSDQRQIFVVDFPDDTTQRVGVSSAGVPITTDGAGTQMELGHAGGGAGHRVVDQSCSSVVFTSRLQLGESSEYDPALGISGHYTFLRDLDAATTIMTSWGSVVGNSGFDQIGIAMNATISDSGTLIAFVSSNERPPLPLSFVNPWEIWLTDRTTNETTWLSLTPHPDGSEGQALAEQDMEISGDGSTIVALVSRHLNGSSGSGQLLVSISVNSGDWSVIAGPGDFDHVHVSDNGGRVVFWSADDVLGRGISSRQIYLYDVVAETLTMVSAGSDSSPTEGVVDNPAISGDGTVVAYEGDSLDVVGGESGYVGAQIFRYDVLSGDTSLVTRAYDGGTADGDHRQPAVNDDGSLIAFTCNRNVSTEEPFRDVVDHGDDFDTGICVWRE